MPPDGSFASVSVSCRSGAGRVCVLCVWSVVPVRRSVYRCCSRLNRVHVSRFRLLRSATDRRPFSCSSTAFRLLPSRCRSLHVVSACVGCRVGSGALAACWCGVSQGFPEPSLVALAARVPVRISADSADRRGDRDHRLLLLGASRQHLVRRAPRGSMRRDDSNLIAICRATQGSRPKMLRRRRFWRIPVNEFAIQQRKAGRLPRRVGGEAVYRKWTTCGQRDRATNGAPQPAPGASSKTAPSSAPRERSRGEPALRRRPGAASADTTCSGPAPRPRARGSATGGAQLPSARRSERRRNGPMDERGPEQLAIQAALWIQAAL